MNKISLRLLVLSLIATVVVVFFLNKLLNKPSHLLDFVPSSSFAVVKVNTRDIAKDVYRYGGFTLDSMEFFNANYPYFQNVTDPRRTGINVYSELFLFRDRVQGGNYNCLLFNLNNLNNYKAFCATNSLLSSVKGKENTLFYSKKDSFYLWVMEKESALIFGVQSRNHLDEIMDKISKTMEDDNNKEFASLMQMDDNLIFWQEEKNNLLQSIFPFTNEGFTLQGNFTPGTFSYLGDLEGDIILKDSVSFFNPNFAPSEETKSGYTFKGEINAPNKKTHPLSYILYRWMKGK